MLLLQPDFSPNPIPVREETKLKAGEYLQTLILLQGYLNKRTSHGSVLGNPFKRRYFYLSSVLLQFGKEPDDPVRAYTCGIYEYSETCLRQPPMGWFRLTFIHSTVPAPCTGVYSGTCLRQLPVGWFRLTYSTRPMVHVL